MRSNEKLKILSFISGKPCLMSAVKSLSRISEEGGSPLIGCSVESVLSSNFYSSYFMSLSLGKKE